MEICVDALPGDETREILEDIAESLKKHFNGSEMGCWFGKIRLECDFRLILDLGHSRNKNSRGVEVLYGKQKHQNERLAKYMLDGICFNTDFMNRGIREENLDEDIFIRCGYISNLSDKEKLSSNKTKYEIVSGIVAGLQEYLLFCKPNERQNSRQQ